MLCQAARSNADIDYLQIFDKNCYRYGRADAVWWISEYELASILDVLCFSPTTDPIMPFPMQLVLH